MKTFLQSVAQDLYSKIGNDLSRTAIVFPNKRASLFFNEYLAAQSDRPLWSPAYVNISELFRSLSPLKPSDPIWLVCELYKVFREETHSEEPLDDFYFWGELLISDFDDADKNLVDADKLFSNLQDLKNIMDDYDFLDQEQEEAIQQFFQNFSIDKRTQLKEKFISLWDKLGDIYRHYRKNLSELGIAYEGMMYRHVIEELDTDRLRYDRYVFVGFNVLNKVETRFFQRLQDAGKAMFYWDYDVFYTRLPHEQQPPYVHEAGEFILRNLKLFPNQLPETALRCLAASQENTFHIRSYGECAGPLPAPMGAHGREKRYRSKQGEGKRHCAMQRGTVAARAALHPAGSGERKHNHGISIGADTRIQLYQRPYGTANRRLPQGYGTLYLRSRTCRTEASLHPATVRHGRRPGEAAHQGQPLLPSPVGA